jgi:phosphate transport system ATP-binding protein
MDASVERALQTESDPRLFIGISTRDLNVQYASTDVLTNICLDARRGEILSIIGPAGAGKTTFLRSLNRMLDLDPDWQISGTVLLNGHSIYARDVQVAALRRKIGMVFSVPVTLPVSIYRNLTFGLNLKFDGRGQRDERVEKALRDAYLWEEVKDRLDEPAGNLSGGQQQRLCLARTLTLEPSVLLLDEPCSGLDPISTRRIEEALQQLKKDLTIVLVTNNVKQAARASDRTAFFLFGKLIEVQKTEDLFTTPREKQTADYISGRFG